MARFLVAAVFVALAFAAPKGFAQESSESEAIAQKYLPDETDEAARPATAVGFVQRADRLLGKFHVVVLHFPIALLLLAAAAQPWLGQAFSLIVHLGALSAICTAVMGWAAARWSQYPAEVTDILFRHRWLGTAAAALALAASVTLHMSKTRGWPLRYCRSILIVATILVAAAGYWGGHLVFGGDYWSW